MALGEVTVSDVSVADVAGQDPYPLPVGAPNSVNHIDFALSPLATIMSRSVGTVFQPPAVTGCVVGGPFDGHVSQSPQSERLQHRFQRQAVLGQV